LFPDYRFPRESAWSELGYSVYTYVLPDVANQSKNESKSVHR
jgi:hypothetical protein